MNDRQPILVYGSTDFGSIVRELAEACGHSFVGFIDDWHAGKDIVGTLEATCKSHPPRTCVVALAIGYKHMEARCRAAERLRDVGYRIASLVHPQAYVAPSATIGEGTLVMARAVVDVRAHLGPITVVWPGAIVSHDCILLGNTFVSPGATLCGYCKIGEDSFLGAGSIVVDHVELPKATFLKAGEVYKTSRPAIHESQPNAGSNLQTRRP